MRIIDLYLGYKEQEKLQEANLRQLYTKSVSETPKIAQRGQTLAGRVRYFGLSKDGTLNFKVASQTIPGGFYYAYIEAPDVLRLGDVIEEGDHLTEADLNRLLTMNGFRVHCFTKDHLVKTSLGDKYIQNIEPGDLVLTHTGEYKPVYKTYEHSYSGELIKINDSITCTPEHKLYIQDKDGNMRWRMAKDLLLTDVLVTPDEPIGYIYKTTCTTNGKIYVGQRRSPRFLEHYLGSGYSLNNAIKKYGVDSFIVEPLEFCSSASVLDEREKFWIKEFDSTNRDIGYNITDGGNKSFPSVKGKKAIHKDDIDKYVLPEDLDSYLNSGWILGKSKKFIEAVKQGTNKAMQDYQFTEEQKFKMGSFNRGKKLSQETRDKIAEAHKKIDHPQFRRLKSEETKKKMSDSAKRRNSLIKGGDQDATN